MPGIKVREVFVKKDRSDPAPKGRVYQSFEEWYQSGDEGPLQTCYQAVDARTGKPAEGYAPVYFSVIGLYLDLVKQRD